jgi:adenylate cyclase class IV
MLEEFEDTKGVIRIRISKKNKRKSTFKPLIDSNFPLSLNDFGCLVYAFGFIAPKS